MLQAYWKTWGAHWGALGAILVFNRGVLRDSGVRRGYTGTILGCAGATLGYSGNTGNTLRVTRTVLGCTGLYWGHTGPSEAVQPTPGAPVPPPDEQPRPAPLPPPSQPAHHLLRKRLPLLPPLPRPRPPRRPMGFAHSIRVGRRKCAPGRSVY